MGSYEVFRKRMLLWWDRLISYWIWLLIGIVLFVIVAFLFQGAITTILGTLADALFPTQNNFISWGLRNPIGFVLIMSAVYILIFVLVALIESQNIRGINFTQGENGENLEVIIENKTGDVLYDCRVIFDDLFQDEESIVRAKELNILPGEDSLLWKDSEWDEIDILNDEKGIISLAKYDDFKDTSFLFTSAGEIELPQGICKLRASLITKDSRSKVNTIIFWVVIQFGEEEKLEIEVEEVEDIIVVGEEKSALNKLFE